MSDETTPNAVDQTAPTEPLSQPAPVAATPTEQPAAQIASAQPAPALTAPAGPSAVRWVFAVSAAVVLAIALTSVSFGAGVLVGKAGSGRGFGVDGRQGAQMMTPGTDSSGQSMTTPNDSTGTQNDGWGRGRGGQRGGGFPGHPGAMGTPGDTSVPQQQTMPAQ